MAPRLLRVALTGGIATGKSRCLAGFGALGVPVIDADKLAREAVAPGTLGHSAIVRRFGSKVIGADGTVDRDALGRVVFDDARARQDLEGIIHPFVYTAIREWFDGLSRTPAFAVADIPLLYETGHERDFDLVIVAACDPAQQRQRLIARDGLSEAEARQRIAAQIPIDQKRAGADYVIDTSGELADTDRQVVEIWERLRRRARHG